MSAAIKHLIPSNTTTPRRLTLILDLGAHTLKAYLNGMLKEKKLISNIEEGVWHPVIEIRG
jgi:hypothetical protein